MLPGPSPHVYTQHAWPHSTHTTTHAPRYSTPPFSPATPPPPHTPCQVYTYKMDVVAVEDSSCASSSGSGGDAAAAQAVQPSSSSASAGGSAAIAAAGGARLVSSKEGGGGSLRGAMWELRLIMEYCNEVRGGGWGGGGCRWWCGEGEGPVELVQCGEGGGVVLEEGVMCCGVLQRGWAAARLQGE